MSLALVRSCLWAAPGRAWWLVLELVIEPVRGSWMRADLASRRSDRVMHAPSSSRIRSQQSLVSSFDAVCVHPGIACWVQTMSVLAHARSEWFGCLHRSGSRGRNAVIGVVDGDR
nr:hypothetical protein CFP56_00946 [Quercus suber]